MTLNTNDWVSPVSVSDGEFSKLSSQEEWPNNLSCRKELFMILELVQTVRMEKIHSILFSFEKLPSNLPCEKWIKIILGENCTTSTRKYLNNLRLVFKANSTLIILTFLKKIASLRSFIINHKASTWLGVCSIYCTVNKLTQLNN